MTHMKGTTKTNDNSQRLPPIYSCMLGLGAAEPVFHVSRSISADIN